MNHASRGIEQPEQTLARVVTHLAESRLQPHHPLLVAAVQVSTDEAGFGAELAVDAFEPHPGPVADRVDAD